MWAPLLSKGLAMGMGAAVATLGGAGITAAAAIHSTHPHPTRGAVVRNLLKGTVLGDIQSVSTTGGADGKGHMTIVEPDGTSLTVSFTPKTVVALYQGQGKKLTKETTANLSKGDIVALKEVRHKKGSTASSSEALTRIVLNTGFHS